MNGMETGTPHYEKGDRCVRFLITTNAAMTRFMSNTILSDLNYLHHQIIN